MLALLEDKKHLALPARKHLDEIYESTLRGLETHRSLTSLSSAWCDDVIKSLGGFLTAKTEADKGRLLALTTPPLEDALAMVKAVICNIESERQAFNSAIGGLLRFRLKILEAFHTRGFHSSSECVAIVAKLEKAMTCFLATNHTLRHAGSVLQQDSNDIAHSVNIVETLLSAETIAMPKLAPPGKQLVRLCQLYKRTHAEYGRVLV